QGTEAMSPPVWRDAVTKKGLSSRVKMFDKNLVHAIIGGKDLDCGSAELSVNLGLTRGHGSLLLDLWYFRAVRPRESNPLHPPRGTAREDFMHMPEECVSSMAHCKGQ